MTGYCAMTQEPPTPGQLKTLIAGMFDRAAETYENTGVEYFTVFGRRLVEHAALRPGELVLDVGCGRGSVTFPAAEAVGAEGKVVAIDLAPMMVTLTAEDARARGLDHVTVRVGDAEAPEFGDAEFDAVLSGFVIFFLPDPARALREYRRVLRDGGRLGLTTFPPQPDGTWAKVGKAIQRYHPMQGTASRPDEAPLASPERLAETVRGAGFADVRTVTEAHDTAFRDPDQWWAWAWSLGQRTALERVPEDELPALREHCYALLRETAGPDGSLKLTQYVTYTVATA